MRARARAGLSRARDQGDRLHRLPQPHVVRQDAVDPVGDEGGQEAQAGELVGAEGAASEGRRLGHTLADRVHGAVVAALGVEQGGGCRVERRVAVVGV